MEAFNPVVVLCVVLAIVSLRKSAESALINVFLPTMLLVPFAFAIHIPHLPAFTCIQAVILTIGIGAVATRSARWRFSRADLWVLLFAFGYLYSDILNLGAGTALFNFLPVFCDTFLAYLMGKLLIEQSGIREQFTQRLVTLLSVVGFISVTEFIGKKNLFLILARRIQSEGYAYDQFRGRFLRIKGPYAGAEQTGIVFMMGFFLALWLWYCSRTRNGAGEPKYFGLRRSTIWLGGILLGLYMPLSRGPWLGAAAGFLVARIGMVKNKALAVVLLLVIAAVGGIYAQKKSAQLAQMSSDSADESTASAQYRTQLFTAYGAVAESGGLFGWSYSGYPRDRHFDSIDNMYLLLWVTQGKVGLYLFIVIAAEGLIAIYGAIRRSRQKLDASFYYCMGGFLAGLMLVLGTVYLTAQGYVFFFMLIGWAQSLRDQSKDAGPVSNEPASRFSFKRVFA